MARQAGVKLNEVPEGWSQEAADFINKVKYSIYSYSVYKGNLLIV
jgi:hypothetical protein